MKTIPEENRVYLDEAGTNLGMTRSRARSLAGERFLYFLQQHLIPTLRTGGVVVMDNCRIHHIAEVKTLLGSVGAAPLFMPPYSPELNPIEEAWSLIKAMFKSLEARTISAYIDALESARQIVTPEKIAAYVDHAASFLTEST